MTSAQLDTIEQEMQQIGELEQLAMAMELPNAPAKDMLFADAAMYAQGHGPSKDHDQDDDDDDEDDDDQGEDEDQTEADSGPGPEEEYSL